MLCSCSFYNVQHEPNKDLAEFSKEDVKKRVAFTLNYTMKFLNLQSKTTVITA